MDEVVDTIKRLRGALESLAIRGLRAATPEDVGLLRAVHEEFERIGAGHMAERIRVLVEHVDAGDREAAESLMRAQTSLQLFDRVLTLDVAEAALAHLAGVDDEDAAGEGAIATEVVP